jgi:hypothetical protein
MFRRALILAAILAFPMGAGGQAIPKEFLARPVRLQLDRPTQQVKVGSTVTYRVQLSNARDQEVAAPRALQLKIEWPGGQGTAEVPAGQSSASFTVPASKVGIERITVRSGDLRPATGLLLVAPPSAASAVPPRTMSPLATATAPQRETASGGGGAGAVHRRAERSHTSEGAAAVPAPSPPPPAMMRASAEASEVESVASKIQLFVDPVTVYGNAVDHVWTAHVSVAATDGQGTLAPVKNDVNIHLNATLGQISRPNIVLAAGAVSDFDNPVLLTADRSGQGTVGAVSTLGPPATPIEVQYLQPPPSELRLSVGQPVLSGTGSSQANVQVCLVDQSGSLAVSTSGVQVALSGDGQIASQVTIAQNSSCSLSTPWTSAPGAATLHAEAVGLKPDRATVTFPAFPWYFAWLAAIGGLLGALVSNSAGLFSARWWSHAWRSLVVGAVFGALFYLFARFGAIALPSDSPLNIQNIPVVSKVGSFLLGFVGGLYGRKLLKVDDDKAGAPQGAEHRSAEQRG